MNLSCKNNKDYFSIIVATFGRVHYLRELIQSLEDFADMSYELIVHEDASPDNSENEIWSFRQKISTLIVNTNTGYNVGLAHSIDRMVNLATSEYILFLNNDCKMVRPCLKDFKNILDKPYVGFLTPYENVEPRNYHIETNGTKYTLRSGLGHGSAMVFRKSFFNEIGGMEHYHSGCSDTPLMYKAFSYGYFRGSLQGNAPIINVSHIEKGNTDSCMSMSGRDCCFPKLFNLRDEGEFRYLCSARHSYCMHNCDSVNQQDGSWSNLGYWHNYSKDTFNGNDSDNPNDINWEACKKHGQDKWKEQIITDFSK